jgi:hypothetical protein
MTGFYRLFHYVAKKINNKLDHDYRMNLCDIADL